MYGILNYGKLKELQLYPDPQLVMQVIAIKFNLHTDLSNQDAVPTIRAQRSTHIHVHISLIYVLTDLFVYWYPALFQQWFELGVSFVLGKVLGVWGCRGNIFMFPQRAF